VARVGLLGGAFNPPHLGHLLMAQEAHDQLGLDRVLLVPVHTPPHKAAPVDPGPEARLELCRLAVGDDPRFAVSDLEVRRGGPSYTVATLHDVHEARPEDELTFIVGADAAQGLPTWREPEEVLRLARLAVAQREGVRREDVLDRVGQVPGGQDRVRFFDMPRMDVSSSLVRRRLAQGRPVRFLVPDAVADRLQTLDAYRPATT
jgi:nicotinate-nucleotide adenylyltransferase